MYRALLSLASWTRGLDEDAFGSSVTLQRYESLWCDAVVFVQERLLVVGNWPPVSGGREIIYVS
jgi:hypothetical protein